jgi:choline dehydrogenase-like flavoprotein
VERQNIDDMIVDIRTLPDGTVVEADLCIIGAGAAGISMAIELSGRRLNVSIVESGGLKLDREVQALADGEQSGIPYFPLDPTRYRLLGGSTFRWGRAHRTSEANRLCAARLGALQRLASLSRELRTE